MPRTIGIDFGTSTTVVCYRDHEDGRPPSDAQFLFPEKMVETVVYEPEHGDPLYATEARRAAEDSGHFDRLARHFKMNLLSEESRPDAQKRMRGFFDFLYERYKERRLVMPGRNIVERTRVSYPAKWPPQLQQATIEAAKDAGFPDVQGMDEPTACMQFFVAHQIGSTEQLFTAGEPVTALLIDLGAGTTDIVIFRTTPGNDKAHEILGVWPPVEGASFGGRDVDAVLSKFFTEYLKANWAEDANIADMETPDELLPHIILHKENVLSAKLSREQVVETFLYVDRYYRRRHFLRQAAPMDRMDRTVFGTISADHLQTFANLVNGAVADVIRRGKLAGAGEIDLAILAGGHSKWYFIREMLCGKWVPGLPGDPASGSGIDLPKLKNKPERCLVGPDPQTVVAQGLTLDGLDIPTPAANSVWYELTVSFTGDSGPPRRWHTEVVRRGAMLPVRHEMFESVDFHRPLSKSTEFVVTSQLAAVIGSSFETGLRFASHPMAGPLRLDQLAWDWIKGKVGNWIKDKSGKSGTPDHLDIYIEFEMTRPDSITYRGIIDLESANRCWPFNYPPRSFQPGEVEALADRLIRRRWHHRRSSAS